MTNLIMKLFGVNPNEPFFSQNKIVRLQTELTTMRVKLARETDLRRNIQMQTSEVRERLLSAKEKVTFMSSAYEADEEAMNLRISQVRQGLKMGGIADGANSSAAPKKVSKGSEEEVVRFELGKELEDEKNYRIALEEENCELEERISHLMAQVHGEKEKAQKEQALKMLLKAKMKDIQGELSVVQTIVNELELEKYTLREQIKVLGTNLNDIKTKGNTANRSGQGRRNSLLMLSLERMMEGAVERFKTMRQ